jgi:hypothetical protein
MNQAFVTWVGKGGSLTATGSISGRATAALFRHRPRFRDNVLTMARRSLAHNFQAVWYRAAIMALCWPAAPSEVKFAVDLYGAFPVKRLFWVVLRVFCSERERPFFVPSPAIRSPERAEGVKGPKR